MTMDVNLTTGRIVLLVLYWISNIIATIGGAVVLIGGAYLSNYFQFDLTFFIACGSVIFLIIVALNRAVYEMSVAIFEIVRHSRQIRDQLCIMNAQETEE